MTKNLQTTLKKGSGKNNFSVGPILEKVIEAETVKKNGFQIFNVG